MSKYRRFEKKMPKGFVYYKRALDVDALTHGTSAVRSLRQKGQPWAGALACLLVLLACIPVSAQQNASTQAPAAGEQTDTSSQSLANPAPTEQASPADQAREAANPLVNIWLLQTQQNNWSTSQPVGGTRMSTTLQRAATRALAINPRCSQRFSTA